MDQMQHTTRSPRSLAALAGLAGLATMTPLASATWSILIADTRTGEIALGSATCVPGINLRASTPVLILGVGGVTAQSAVDTSGANRAVVFDGYAKGWTPDQIFAELAATDGGHGNRQYGFIDVLGNTLTYSGPQNAAWAGGVTGRIEAGAPGPADDIVYSVQGNILTGEPVVLAAEDAILNTPGDLAEKLMAAMEAAYAFGGDGRCSCPGPDPTGCGAPPVDGFTRTADVGYMLVGRLGDREQAGAFAPIPFPAGETLVGDLDGDGMGDIVHFPSFFGPVVYRRNITTDPSGPPVFEPQDLLASSPTPGYAAIGDIDGDGLNDLVFTAGTNIRVVRSQGGGAFSPEAISPAGAAIDAAALGEFDASSPGLELAVLSSNGLRTYAFDGAGAATLVSSQQNVVADAADAIGATDGAVVLFDGTQGFVPFASNGDGSFTPGTPVGATGSPSVIRVGDLNGDGADDIVWGAALTSLGVLLSDGNGGYAQSTEQFFNNGTAQQVRAFEITDIDGDGDGDIAALLRFGRFGWKTDDGQGGLADSPIRRVLDGLKLGVGDVSGDGLPDFVTTESRVIGAFVNDGAGLPDDAAGFAGGDYFLELNVAGAPDAGYDDPVPQLRDEFDAWRADRVGVPDGSRSSLAGLPARVYAAGSAAGPYTLTATILDYDGTPVPGLTLADFAADAPAGAPRGLAVDAVNAVPGQAGVYEVTVSAAGATGASSLWLRLSGQTVGGDAYTAVIQPAPPYTGAASLADFDANGVLDLADIVAFITAFNNGEDAADLTGNGVRDLDDITLFIQEFTAG